LGCSSGTSASGLVVAGPKQLPLQRQQNPNNQHQLDLYQKTILLF
jgi:hypothetical protein